MAFQIKVVGVWGSFITFKILALLKLAIIFYFIKLYLIWTEMVEVYLIPKVCLTSKLIKTKHNFFGCCRIASEMEIYYGIILICGGQSSWDYQIFTGSLGCIFHNWFVELQFKTIYYMCSLLNVHVDMNSWIRVTQEH